MPREPRLGYLAQRPEAVHDTSLSSPFAHVAERMEVVLADLVGAVGSLAGTTVVDFGCAERPYRSLFADARYLGADLPGNDGADLEIGRDGRVPVEDGSVDLVFSSQVLEHVDDPVGYLAECRRMLRPGGSLVLSTHGVMYLHRDPTDYWRWTCDGLDKIVTDAGFVVQELRGVLGLVGASLQLLQSGVALKVPRRLRRAVVVAFQLLIKASDRYTSETSRRENGLVLAVRATKASPA